MLYCLDLKYSQSNIILLYTHQDIPVAMQLMILQIPYKHLGDK